jgi:hypothetical protein
MKHDAEKPCAAALRSKLFCETNPGFSGIELWSMVVRIRFERGPRVQRRKGKNLRVALVTAGLLTLGSVSCLVLGLWRLGVDFGWAGEFAFPEGTLLSHWQVWFVGALAIQSAVGKLNRYGKPQGSPLMVEQQVKKAMAAKA